MWSPSGANANPRSPCSAPVETCPLRSSTGTLSTRPPRIANTPPDFEAMYRARSSRRVAMAKAPEIPATGVSRTRTAAKLVVPSGAAVVPPAPPPLERRGVVGAGRLGAAGADVARVVDGATATGAVEVVVSATGDTNGDGPTARSRWLR